MHLLLIYLSVIILLGYITGSEVQDLSDWCSRGGIYDSYLTFGVGYSDKLVSMISAEGSFNCILNFTVKAKNYIMLVLEFPDLQPKEKICVSPEDSGSSVMVSGYDEKKNCQYIGSEPIYRSLSFEQTTVFLKSLHDLSTIKITATSMRGLKGLECFDVNETECNFADHVYCMTNEIACDGHNNCGVPDLYDEDTSVCKGKSLSFLMVIASLVMGVLTIFLFGSICLTLLPKRKETFVYRNYETISIFDSENAIVSAEIDIQVLFPEKVKILQPQTAEQKGKLEIK